MVQKAVYHYTFVLFVGRNIFHIIWKGTSFVCMGEVVLTLQRRQRERKRGGRGRCWFLIDLSTLQRKSVGPAVCSLQLGQGLKRRRWWRGRAPVDGTNAASLMSKMQQKRSVVCGSFDGRLSLSLNSWSCPTTRHGGAWGERRYSSYSFSTSALAWSEWSASRPGRALAPGKSTHGTGGWVGPRAGLDTGARGKILSSLPGIEPRSPGRPARNQTLYWLSCPAH
jgi:hypothetical protein